jgi:GH24 family phage-related lysozyme (muramidase)
MPPDPILLHEIQRDEGRQPCVYKDTKGLWTIGDGILVDPTVPGAGLLPEEMDFITNNRVGKLTPIAIHLCGQPMWEKLGAARQRAVLNMLYNLGPIRLAGFKNMFRCFNLGDYTAAASEMKASDWYKETGDRGKRLVTQMETGIDQ